MFLPGALVTYSTIRNNLCNQFQFKILKFSHLHEGTTSELSVQASVMAWDASCTPNAIQLPLVDGRSPSAQIHTWDTVYLSLTVLLAEINRNTPM